MLPNFLRTRLLIALALATVVPLTAELGLRLFRPVGYLRPRSEGKLLRGDWTGMVHVPSKTPGLLYEVAANLDCETRGMRIRTNSFGMRDSEPLPGDTPGLVRIAAIGDSFTFGFTVQQGEDYPAQLEHVLQEREGGGPRRFDVLNFGVGGYSTREEAVVLGEKALAFHPDLILIGYCLNDPEDQPIQPLHSHFQPPALWRYSHLLRLIAGRVEGWEIRHYGQGGYFQYLHAPDGPRWPRVAAEFDRIRDMARARGIPVVLVVMPMLLCSRWDDYPFSDIHVFVANEARSRGFLVVDPCAVLRQFAPAELVASASDCHLNALGNRLAAQAIAAGILPLLDSAGRH